MTHDTTPSPAKPITHLTGNQFQDRFTRVVNPFDDDALWSTLPGLPGYRFGFHRLETEFVFAQDPARVWTFVEVPGEEGLFLVSGIVTSSRLGYVVTEEPVPAGESIRVEIAFCEHLLGGLIERGLL